MNQIVDPIALGTYGTCRALESFGKKRPSSEGGSFENRLGSQFWDPEKHTTVCFWQGELYQNAKPIF